MPRGSLAKDRKKYNKRVGIRETNLTPSGYRTNRSNQKRLVLLKNRVTRQLLHKNESYIVEYDLTNEKMTVLNVTYARGLCEIRPDEEIVCEVIHRLMVTLSVELTQGH